MKYIRFFIIIIIVCVLSGLGIGMSGILKTSDIMTLRSMFNSQESFFSDSDYGISFHYPRTWKKEFAPPNMSVLTNGTHMRVVVALEKLKDTAMTLDEFTKKNMQEFSDSGQYGTMHIDVHTTGTTTLAGLPAGELEYSTQEDGTVMHGIQVWTLKSGKAYMVSMSAPDSEYGESVQTFKKMLESMQIQ